MAAGTFLFVTLSHGDRITLILESFVQSLIVFVVRRRRLTRFAPAVARPRHHHSPRAFGVDIEIIFP